VLAIVAPAIASAQPKRPGKVHLGGPTFSGTTKRTFHSTDGRLDEVTLALNLVNLVVSVSVVSTHVTIETREKNGTEVLRYVI
jgi:hypothetical protein